MADRRTLKMIKALMDVHISHDDLEDEKELLRELKKRSAKVKSGESKLLTLEESRAAYEVRKAKRKK